MPKKSLPKFETALETYTYKDQIGEGGAGRVFLVEDSAGKEFALKCLVADRITKERVKRFKNELTFCQTTTHPNVVKVLDSGFVLDHEKKCPFYVMPFYDSTLRDLIGKIGFGDILPLFSQILDGVEVAHLMSVWHRDLKPENILYDSNTRTAAIADFGIAHFGEESLFTLVETNPHQRLANFVYSAPEQRSRGSKVDLRADIFALGLILNELFTSQVPHGSDHRTISLAAPGLGYLDGLVEIMTKQDPDKRPNNIRDIKQELRGRRNTFFTLQELDQAKSKVVKPSEEIIFDPLQFIDVDVKDGTLILILDKNAPQPWVHFFQHPPGGHSFLNAYTPTRFEIQGRTIKLDIRGDVDSAPSLVEYAKQYLAAANKGYSQHLLHLAKENEKSELKAQEARVRELEVRQRILGQIQL